MSLTAAAVFRRFWAWKYDGTAAAAATILASAQEWQTVRGPGATWTCPVSDQWEMVLRRQDSWGNTSDLIIPAGRWLVCNGDDGPSDVVTEDFYLRAYRPMSEMIPVPPSYLGLGVGTLSALLLGGATATVNCQVRPPAPAGITVQLTAAPLAAGIKINILENLGFVPTSTDGGVTTLAHTRVRATVQNTGPAAVLLGTPTVLATVHV